MSEINKDNSILIPAKTRHKLLDISGKFGKLNTGSTSDEFWLGMSNSGGYSWEQLDIGINKEGQLVTCTQRGCSCYGPDQPTGGTEYDLTKPIRLKTHDDDYYEPYDTREAVNELIEQTDILYRILNDKAVSAEKIISIPNSEIRRAVVELVGYDKVAKNATIIDESEVDGRLMKIPLKNDEDIMLLHVKDPSTDREYFLRVPPEMASARQARAWTFGFEAHDFELVKES